jgi:transcriptional regulator with XRE-family HTH domain
MTTAAAPVGDLLRGWRQRRHLSQLDLAGDADISTRHLSFIETGRSTPSREMVLRLAERLEVPLRARNTLLTAAGYAPVYAERPLGDPALAPARRAIDHLLAAHEPFPAIAIDRHWRLVANNQAAARLMGGVDPSLIEPHVNVLRLSLHPGGLASRIANLAQWRGHLLARLRHQVDVSADPVLTELLRELSDYALPEIAGSASSTPVGSGASLAENVHGRATSRNGAAAPAGAGGASPPNADDYAGVFVPLQLRTDAGLLSFLSTTTIFGTPVDVTLSEIALESFFPADPWTGEALRRAAGGSGSGHERD